MRFGSRASLKIMNVRHVTPKETVDLCLLMEDTDLWPYTPSSFLGTALLSEHAPRLPPPKNPFLDLPRGLCTEKVLRPRETLNTYHIYL